MRKKYTVKQAILSELQSNLESLTEGDWMEVFGLSKRQAIEAVRIAKLVPGFVKRRLAWMGSRSNLSFSEYEGPRGEIY